MVKKLIVMLLGLSLASPVFLTGCNTIRGVGTDIKQAGQGLSEEAAEHKSY